MHLFSGVHSSLSITTNPGTWAGLIYLDDRKALRTREERRYLKKTRKLKKKQHRRKYISFSSHWGALQTAYTVPISVVEIITFLMTPFLSFKETDFATDSSKKGSIHSLSLPFTIPVKSKH
jgi:hypothetical protein